ncbi:hypothetical protein HDU97_006198 [Phlyctochytrium planicorne]|nr:hypothetical protein HDU97_006198 [Phlyctochytrium planicorne]
MRVTIHPFAFKASFIAYLPGFIQSHLRLSYRTGAEKMEASFTLMPSSSSSSSSMPFASLSTSPAASSLTITVKPRSLVVVYAQSPCPIATSTSDGTHIEDSLYLKPFLDAGATLLPWHLSLDMSNANLAVALLSCSDSQRNAFVSACRAEKRLLLCVVGRPDESDFDLPRNATESTTMSGRKRQRRDRDSDIDMEASASLLLSPTPSPASPTESHATLDTDDTEMTLASSALIQRSVAYQPSSSLHLPTITLPPAPSNKKPSLTLIGAGPGSPGLLTLAAVESLRQATLIITDRLVPHALLEYVLGPAPWPHVVTARKTPGRAKEAQDEIQEWMVQGVLAGHNVVRLKGGDPFVFGRGGEEVLFLRKRLREICGELWEVPAKNEVGIPTSSLSSAFLQLPPLPMPGSLGTLPIAVIPGISSSLSAPLLAGIPVTHRSVSTSLLISTGHLQDGSSPSLPPYSPTRTTVLLMSIGKIDRLVKEMVGMGYPEMTPTCVVEKAGCSDMRVVRCGLGEVGMRVAEAGIGGHATVVVGDVCGVLE